MNKLTTEERARILHLLCEGQSIRAITRLTEVSKNTVTKLLIDAGKACMAYHDANVRNVKSNGIQVDEIWSFTYAKQENVATAKAAPDGAGDTWTWTAIEADTKLIVSYFVGGRDGECAIWFMDDLRSRLANRVQLTADGHKAYLEAVEGAFGGDIDYPMLIKIYGASPESAKGRYSPAECTGAHKERIEGSPDLANVSTSYAERQNLAMRMHMRRFIRLTRAFSKKVENHAYAVALHMTYYNFVRIHLKLRMTPAMAAGVSDRLWEIGDIVAIVEAAEAKPAKRGSYKKLAEEISN
ncbi:helix-turn-helix domain-containing protein (plasmid) [Methylocapsa polymorpha]|uniref:Helix-turn-helix domain-containing protein n=1 Tax=Methylocapsa polymorpha TaxID=3080828 RepID=A0ABZ0HY97_9HYPH|nr:helix-turn-helix domain-containing protein [Methylocapsa sp. RX1]WOJ91757.1 helix-turn-helix domain-containing protein [Methylocapsa sp. RX1]